MEWTITSSLVLLLAILGASTTVQSSGCNLDGQWYDPNISTSSAQFIFKFDDDLLLAVTPNLRWTTGTVVYAPPNIIATLDDNEVIKGTVNQTSCDSITWTTPMGTWVKIPAIKQVHVIFMNHLDVGYNGIPKTGFINNILNTYFQEYFPRAINLGREMMKEDPNHGFIYTTHPWLLDMYLNCPKDFAMNDVTLYCPTEAEISTMESAIRDGLITWHAGPMNMQIELMNKYVLKASMQIAKQLDARFGHQTTVLSQRDVPGITAGAIATLVNECGIKAVTVGVNPSSSPPAVPKLFQWKLHKESKESLIAMWHPGGYPNNPGSSLSNAGGISIMDTTISLADEQALVFAFRTDNSGPPESLDEIHAAFDILERQFEGAKVSASTLDNFINSVTKESLETVSGEIGDTWIQGIASDPLKMALYRYGAKALQMCIDDGQCTMDAETIGYLRFLVKLPEHTWGLPSCYDTGNWSNDDFEIYRRQVNFRNAEDSWKEQRLYFNMTRELSSKATNTNYSSYLEKILSQNNLDAYPIDMNNYKQVDMKTTFSLQPAGIPISISFGQDGSIASLRGQDYTLGTIITLADPNHTVGAFTYHTYNESDYNFANSEYGYNGNAGYDKPNITNNAHPMSGIHSIKMVTLYQSTVDTEFCALLAATVDLYLDYGASSEIWNCVQILKITNEALFPLQLIFKVTLFSKGSTRLPEASMYSFTPTPHGTKKWNHQMFKVDSYSGKSKIPTGGITLDSILKNGTFYQHAVEELYLIDNLDKIVFKAKSVEIPIVCPIFDSTKGFRTPNPLPILSRPDDTSVLRGFAFNIHNNVWNTNYPFWYPFDAMTSNIRGNFEITWDKEQ